MVQNSLYEHNPETRCWFYNGEIIVEWDSVLLVYPNFYGYNNLEETKDEHK